MPSKAKKAAAHEKKKETKKALGQDDDDQTANGTHAQMFLQTKGKFGKWRLFEKKQL